MNKGEGVFACVQEVVIFIWCVDYKSYTRLLGHSVFVIIKYLTEITQTVLGYIL